MPFHSSELLSWQRGARKGAELFLSFENLGFPSRTEPLPFHSTPRDKRGAVARGRRSRQGNTPRDTGGQQPRASGLACRGSGEADGARHLFLGTAASPGCRGGMGAGICLDVHPRRAVPRSRPRGGDQQSRQLRWIGAFEHTELFQREELRCDPSKQQRVPGGRSGTRSKGSGRTSVLLPAAAPGLEGGVGPEGGAGSPSRLQAAAERCSRSVEFQAPWKTGSRQAPRATLPRPLTPAASTSSLQLNPPKPRDNNEPQLPPRPTAPRGRAGHGQARAG